MGVEDLAANPTLAPDPDDVKSDMECRPLAQTVA